MTEEFVNRRVEDLQLFLYYRNVEKHPNLDTEQQVVKNWDFSKSEDHEGMVQDLLTWKPDLLVYCAGGGPHGAFSKKKWVDHQWALEVSFLFPAKVLHAFLQSKLKTQMIFIGSQIAENEPNELSPSYGAAKKALRGLIQSVAENTDQDVRLLSPGYMNTRMLPRNAPPRKKYEMLEPENVAVQLLDWSMSREVSHWHLELPNQPLKL